MLSHSLALSLALTLLSYLLSLQRTKGKEDNKDTEHVDGEDDNREQEGGTRDSESSEVGEGVTQGGNEEQVSPRKKQESKPRRPKRTLSARLFGVKKLAASPVDQATEDKTPSPTTTKDKKRSRTKSAQERKKRHVSKTGGKQKEVLG